MVFLCKATPAAILPTGKSAAFWPGLHSSACRTCLMWLWCAMMVKQGVTNTFPFKCLDVQIAIFYLTQGNTSSCPFPDLQSIGSISLKLTCAKEPPGTATVHYFFARARLDLQFLTTCVHIGHIWSASVQQSHWLSQLCRIFLWDCSSFIRQPRETRTSNLTDKAFVLVNGYFNY